MESSKNNIQGMPSLIEIMDELKKTINKISVSEMLDVADALNGAKRIFIAGIGRSGLIGKTFAMRLVHMGFLVYIVGDATTPAIQANDLLVIVTGSGTTKTLQLYAEEAISFRAELIVITASADSPIGDLAQKRLIIPAEMNYAGVAMSRTLQPEANVFEQCLMITLDYLAMILMKIKALDSEKMFERHANLQ
jgi:6-phospho-3-hexuloisomerase